MRRRHLKPRFPYRVIGINLIDRLPYDMGPHPNKKAATEIAGDHNKMRKPGDDIWYVQNPDGSRTAPQLNQKQPL